MLGIEKKMDLSLDQIIKSNKSKKNNAKKNNNTSANKKQPVKKSISLASLRKKANKKEQGQSVFNRLHTILKTKNTIGKNGGTSSSAVSKKRIRFTKASIRMANKSFEASSALAPLAKKANGNKSTNNTNNKVNNKSINPENVKLSVIIENKKSQNAKKNKNNKKTITINKSLASTLANIENINQVLSLIKANANDSLIGNNTTKKNNGNATKKNTNGVATSVNETYGICIRNLHPNASKEDIMVTFSKFGKIKNINYHKSNDGQFLGVCEVRYTDKKAMQNAIKKFNNQMVDGRILKITKELTISGVSKGINIASIGKRRNRRQRNNNKTILALN